MEFCLGMVMVYLYFGYSVKLYVWGLVLKYYLNRYKMFYDVCKWVEWIWLYFLKMYLGFLKWIFFYRIVVIMMIIMVFIVVIINEKLVFFMIELSF